MLFPTGEYSKIEHNRSKWVIFHMNYANGADAKRDLLKQMDLWFL